MQLFFTWLYNARTGIYPEEAVSIRALIRAARDVVWNQAKSQRCYQVQDMRLLSRTPSLHQSWGDYWFKNSIGGIVMKTEEMRSVLETLARSFTNRDDLSVMWDINPCTDFNKMYLRPDEAIVPGVECSPGELWLSQKAATAHESAHLIFTSEKDWKDFCRGLLEAHILNIVEDARVERAMANLFPGTLRWFRFTNEYIFVNRKDWTAFPRRIRRYMNCVPMLWWEEFTMNFQKERRNLFRSAPLISTRGVFLKQRKLPQKKPKRLLEYIKITMVKYRHYHNPKSLSVSSRHLHRKVNLTLEESPN